MVPRPTAEAPHIFLHTPNHSPTLHFNPNQNTIYNDKNINNHKNLQQTQINLKKNLHNNNYFHYLCNRLSCLCCFGNGRRVLLHPQQDTNPTPSQRAEHLTGNTTLRRAMGGEKRKSTTYIKAFAKRTSLRSELRTLRTLSRRCCNSR